MKFILTMKRCRKCIADLSEMQKRFLQLKTTRTKTTNVSYKVLDGKSDLQPPLLLAHGVMGNKMNFNSVARKLNEATGRMVITYDARNHGRSPHSESMTLEDMAYDAVALLDFLEVKKCVFVGHSMGGRVAMQTALSHPDRLDKLIVVDSSPSVSTSTHFAGATLNYVKAMKSVIWNGEDVRSMSDARRSADFQLQRYVPENAVRSFLLTNIVQKLPDKYEWRVNLNAIEDHIKLSRQINASGNLQPYSNDTLFIGGGDSNYITSDDYTIIRKLFPKSVISHIPNCGHWVHSERPTEFVSSVITFLQPKVMSLF